MPVFKKYSINPSVLPILSVFAHICPNKWDYHFWLFLYRVSFISVWNQTIPPFWLNLNSRNPATILRFNFLSCGNEKPHTHFGTHCIDTCSSLVIFSSTSFSSLWSLGKIISIWYTFSPLWSLMGQLVLCDFLALIEGSIEILGLFVQPVLRSMLVPSLLTL